MDLGPIFPDEIFYHVLTFIEDEQFLDKRLVCNKWRIHLSTTCYERLPKFHLLKCIDDIQFHNVCNILKFVAGKLQK